MENNVEEGVLEISDVNLDKMVFKFISESEIQDLLDKQNLNIKKEQVVEIIEKISSQYEEIKTEVQKRLSYYLPDYEYEKFEVLFTLDRRSDFRCPNDNEIIVDLGRLIRNSLDNENLVSGITHEVFHVYFNHLPKAEMSDINYEIINSEKARILLRSLDEGFAVNISRQNLEVFYNTRLNKEYNIKLAFDKFNEFLQLSDDSKIATFEKEGFESMGYFYVVGYEMLKAITIRQGEDSIKQILVKLDFLEIFERYEEISKTDSNLCQVDFDALRKIIVRK
jgi:hypothetical protein